ncbi:Uncharacterised protein [Mycobacterium tuberculosis]|uniref:Uncharacterized protein n=1 Tax=Mycobacterium tuberculosis TaxID=1773 RepID=A0A0T9AVT4_MYCTX|nr:Uncharacterised protein [Mycobacterium tuberculosis]CFS02586.1 Uncharacterised protein [Mycobacterium tuberculosis]CKO54205.1 Uncharacterised protein [Mycobacterium tuberculosis]CNX29142.1 Uncharacterised protein [Mycobacterium tuberculosis]COV73970.1 Uncharacterised protein [Mycobacterium tuberculosis]
MNPPTEAKDLLNVPITTSMRAKTPNAAEAPRPSGPSTPSAWDSST